MSAAVTIDQGYRWLTQKPSHPPYSLEVVEAAYQHLGSPLHHTPTFLVAGTNGKGLTAACLYALWQNLGCSVGLFTSPHVLHISERCQISSAAPKLDALAATAAHLSTLLPQELFERLSSFELLTLCACWMMQQAAIDVAVMEVGLGGRLDATNILHPDVSLITSIDYDHRDILGDTLREIAAEKAGICRKDGIWLLGWGAQLPQLQDFWQLCKRQYPRMVVVQDSRHLPLPPWLHRSQHDAPGHVHQALHLALRASESLRQILSEKGSASRAVADPADLCHRIQEWPSSMPLCLRGRSEILSYGNYQIYVDVAHNPAGITAALEGFRAFAPGAQAPLGLFSLLVDKDIYGILEVISRTFSQIILCADDHDPRNYGPAPTLDDPLMKWHQHPSAALDIIVRESWQEAWTLFHQLLGKKQGRAAGYVGGSFYAAREALSSSAAVATRCDVGGSG